MQTCDPLQARMWFKLREPINWAVSIAVFAILFLVLMWPLPALFAFVAAAVVSFCLHFFYLDNRMIRIKCPYGRCREVIETNTPWICGHKGCKNENVDEFPFIYKCEHCGYYPKAYKCHHCGELIFFTDDEQKTGYAECANYALRAAIVKKREGHHEMMTDKRQAVESKELDVDLGKLDIRLKRFKQVLNPPARPSTPVAPTPRMPTPDEELAVFLKQNVGDEDAAEKRRAIVREEWKHDQVECDKRLRLIDEWVARRLK